MINKQPQTDIKTTVQPTDILKLYNTNATTIHYILHNLFRGLKPTRRKYKLTINEIIFLNGVYLFCKHESTCISQDACLRFIGYCNLNKVKYYIGSLKGKGMIEMAEVIEGYNRYKITPQGISVMNDINGSFEICLYDWFNNYSICL
jgi:predicted transcriptional regulator